MPAPAIIAAGRGRGRPPPNAGAVAGSGCQVEAAISRRLPGFFAPPARHRQCRMPRDCCGGFGDMRESRSPLHARSEALEIYRPLPSRTLQPQEIVSCVRLPAFLPCRCCWSLRLPGPPRALRPKRPASWPSSADEKPAELLGAYLVKECDKLLDARREEVRSLETPEAVRSGSSESASPGATPSARFPSARRSTERPSARSRRRVTGSNGSCTRAVPATT